MSMAVVFRVSLDGVAKGEEEGFASPNTMQPISGKPILPKIAQGSRFQAYPDSDFRSPYRRL
jgi:hypothetical protein